MDSMDQKISFVKRFACSKIF